MADESADEALREAARNRGLKLVKSRRRKAGVGDFGKFGLLDANGERLLGFGDDGLTATREDVSAYLRHGEQQTWAKSAAITPDPPSPRRENAPPEASNGESTPFHSGPATTMPRRRGKKATSSSRPIARRRRGAADQGRSRSHGDTTQAAQAKAAPGPEPEPELVIRAAHPSDAGVLVELAGLADVDTDIVKVGELIDRRRRSKEPIIIAERGSVIGFVAWESVTSLDMGAIGRIIALVVHPDERRQGIGRRLLDTVLAAMRKRGCAGAESLTDIEVRNANGFFRRTDFRQTSYRFYRMLK